MEAKSVCGRALRTRIKTLGFSRFAEQPFLSICFEVSSGRYGNYVLIIRQGDNESQAENETMNDELVGRGGDFGDCREPEQHFAAQHCLRHTGMAKWAIRETVRTLLVIYKRELCYFLTSFGKWMPGKD